MEIPVAFVIPVLIAELVLLVLFGVIIYNAQKKKDTLPVLTSRAAKKEILILRDLVLTLQDHLKNSFIEPWVAPNLSKEQMELVKNPCGATVGSTSSESVAAKKKPHHTINLQD